MTPFDDRPLADTPLVVLDTETTGLFPGLGDRIIEIAAIRVEGGRVTGQMSQLIQPGRPIEPSAAKVSGIRDSDLAHAPPFAAVAPELLTLLDGALIVAHNVEFDASFLGMELFIWRLREVLPAVLAGHTPPALLPNPWLCTLTLARNAFHFGRHSLSHMAQSLGVRRGRAHRALGDVYTTWEILKRMAQQLERSRRWRTSGDLLHAQGGARYAPPPPAVFLPPPMDEAVLNGRRLNILYFDEGPSRQRIDPLYPAVHQGIPHLIAYSHTTQGQYPFRLDRIFSASLVGHV